MYQGTTPTILLTIPGVDLTKTKIYLTIEDRKKETSMTFATGDEELQVEWEKPDTLLFVRLSQEQTLALPTGSIWAQARWIDEAGQAWATEAVKLVVQDVLYKEVITYGD